MAAVAQQWTAVQSECRDQLFVALLQSTGLEQSQCTPPHYKEGADASGLWLMQYAVIYYLTSPAARFWVDSFGSSSVCIHFSYYMQLFSVSLSCPPSFLKSVSRFISVWVNSPRRACLKLFDLLLGCSKCPWASPLYYVHLLVDPDFSWFLNPQWGARVFVQTSQLMLESAAGITQTRVGSAGVSGIWWSRCRLQLTE